MSSLSLKKLGFIKAGVAASGLFLLLSLQGCSDAHALLWNKADAVIDGHRVVITPCRASYTKTISDTPANRDHIFACHDNSIAVHIKNDEMSVNEKSYGTLKRGDRVAVRDGKVFINEKEAAALAAK
jgi:hypothetical protein